MNLRNLVCWAVVLGGYAILMYWGNSQPVTLERGRRSGWARLMQRVDRLPIAIPGKTAARPEPTRPPLPAPPPAMTRAEAEEVIRASVYREHFDTLAPRLRRGIRIGPVPVDSAEDIPRGASRVGVPPDVPTDFKWPLADGLPLLPLAQIRLADVAQLDEDHLLPPGGWLCFFYAARAQPPYTGRRPEHRRGWQVVFFEGDVNTLHRARPPRPLKSDWPPCEVRFWPEWHLPDTIEEPTLFERDTMNLYYDLRGALTGWPRENGWHHLLGDAQNLSGPMRPVCQLAARGTPVDPGTDLADSKLRRQLVGAGDWTLLLQVDLDALATLDALTVPHARTSIMAPYRSDSDRVYFWIRAADLKARDFRGVWLQRQGAFEEQEDAPAAPVEERPGDEEK